MLSIYFVNQSHDWISLKPSTWSNGTTRTNKSSKHSLGNFGLAHDVDAEEDDGITQCCENGWQGSYILVTLSLVKFYYDMVCRIKCQLRKIKSFGKKIIFEK